MHPGDRVELLREGNKWVPATVHKVGTSSQIITLHFHEDGLVKEKNVRFRDAERLLKLCHRPSLGNATTPWKIGDLVDVKRTDGTWQRATVQHLNLITRTYQVVFAIDGNTKGKSVPFDLVAQMLRAAGHVEELTAMDAPRLTVALDYGPSNDNTDSAQYDSDASRDTIPAVPSPTSGSPKHHRPPVTPHARASVSATPLPVPPGTRQLVERRASFPGRGAWGRSRSDVLVADRTRTHTSHLADIFEDLSEPQWDEEGGPFGPGPDREPHHEHEGVTEDVPPIAEELPPEATEECDDEVVGRHNEEIQEELDDPFDSDCAGLPESECRDKGAEPVNIAKPRKKRARRKSKRSRAPHEVDVLA
jgi:hypothetical protein